ncbi:hypothetical protein [Streptosporangium sp. NPDC004631]
MSHCDITWCETTYPHTTIHRAVMPTTDPTTRVEIRQVGDRPAEVVTTTYGPYGQVTKTRHTAEAAAQVGRETYTSGDIDLGCWLMIASDLAGGVLDALAHVAPAESGGVR